MAYPEKVFKKANNILSETKQKNALIMQSRKAEIYGKIPRIKEIDKLLAATGAEVIKLVISNPDKLDELLNQLEHTNLSLQMDRANLLEKNGYAPTYLEEIFSCKNCKDKGYIGNVMCDCYKRILKQIIYAQMDSSVNIKDFTFKNFNLEYYPKGNGENSPYNAMLLAKQYAMEYANNFSENVGSIIFLGKTGLGKTHLSLSIANVVIEKGFGVMYGSAQNLLYKIEKEKFSYDNKEDKDLDTLQMALQSDLLILDDLGTEHLTQFTRSVIYNIINTRIIEKKPTIISTNLEANELMEKYTDRVVSRLFGEYKAFMFTGNDIRIAKNLNRK